MAVLFIAPLAELDVQVGIWFKVFNGSLLFLPDSIFSLQEECKREDRRKKNLQSIVNKRRQTSQQISRCGSIDEASTNIDAKNNDPVLPVALAILTQSQQADSQISKDGS